MIELMTRIQSPELYKRMLDSAYRNAYGHIETSSEKDDVGLPKCAETYNRLASKSKADIFCFVEDDIEFMTPDWDRIVEEIFLEYDPDILGVVGTTEYHGGSCFDAGNRYAVGLIATNKAKNEEETWVRLYSPHFRYKKVKIIDGSLMFVSRSFWEKNPFDEKTFDELFYYDIDVCLKSDKVAVTCEILAKHSKPAHFYGKYPPNMKPASAYNKLLEERHGLIRQPLGSAKDHICCFISLKGYKEDGQTRLFNDFAKRYQCASV